jgi:hypothetical protein
MNLTELQILFQQKIQDTNPVFEVDQRPDSFEICLYLNKAVDRYLEKKYLALPSFEHRLLAIDQNIDELHDLIKPNGLLTASKDLTEYNWSSRGHRYRTPDDILIPISLPCTVTRTEVYPMANQPLFADWMSRRQAQKLISNTSDKVMYPKPIAVWEDPYYIMLIGDAYTTVLTAGLLTYLRKPYKLDHGYSEIAGTSTGNVTITAITTGEYFLAKSRFTYVDPAGVPAIFKPGDKVLKVAGSNTLTFIDEPIIVGYPWGYTNKPDFPAYIHEGLVDIAVSMFLDESKFKLVSKSA